MTATPWLQRATKLRIESEKSASIREPVGVRPMRLRPLTPGCSACAHQGQASHGFRHSVTCQKRRAEWLAKQEEPPLARAVKAREEGEHAQEEPKPTRPRLMTDSEIAAAPSAAAADQRSLPQNVERPVIRPTTRLRVKTPPMETDLGTKRKPELPPEEIDEERVHREESEDVQMMIVIQTLEEEAQMVTDQCLPEEQVRLENGVDWAPRSWTQMKGARSLNTRNNTGKQLTEMEQPPRKPHLEPSPKSPNHKENEEAPAPPVHKTPLEWRRWSRAPPTRR